MKRAHPAPPVEPELAKQRVVALWLSRICVPAMYLMIYSLAAMMPSLPVLQSLRPSMQTLVSSVWMVMRFLAFVLLGATVFWHTRPRILLVAAAMIGNIVQHSLHAHEVAQAKAALVLKA